MAIVITNKQLEILTLLYRFRFLNRIHIQTLLKHKGPKRINEWLRELTELKLVGRIYSTKLKENTKPAIYYLLPKSKKLLVHENGVREDAFNRLYKEKNRSQRFINHNLTLADFYLGLLKEETAKLDFYTKTDLLNHPYLIQPLPDAYVRKENDKRIKRYFLDIIDEGTPRFVLRKRIEQFIEYYDSGEWTEATKHPFPDVLLLCPNDTVKKFLHRHISRVIEEEMEVEVNFYLSEKDNVEWVKA